MKRTASLSKHLSDFSHRYWLFSEQFSVCLLLYIKKTLSNISKNLEKMLTYPVRCYFPFQNNNIARVKMYCQLLLFLLLFLATFLSILF